mmetsp:Transcript_8088/g.11561  ORF Transcript_8088/g.11561 Transcript_8088/m.11561 type:complete len:231 (-) Transcript_8088:1212-1904(-)
MVYVFISEMKQLLYFSVKIFFNSILSIFFRDVEIIGMQNIPMNGPVIFTSNHANQFIDSVVLLSTCQRTISFLIAEKSWKRKIIGHIAWAMGAVPVKRAQDSAKKGTGSISIFRLLNEKLPSNEEHEIKTSTQSDNNITCLIKGHGTKFITEVKCGDKIQIVIDGSAVGMKVTKIEDDLTIHAECPDVSFDFDKTKFSISYKIFLRVDQKDVYEMVLAKLASGGGDWNFS